MNIAVIGAGAIGSLVAAYLARENADVVLVARPHQIKALSREGLTIEGPRGHVSVSLPVCEKLDQEFDWVILAVKTQDLAQALQDNYAHLGHANILTTQNGVRSEKIVAESLPRARVYASIVMFGATYLIPGRILHNFEGSWAMGPAGQGSRDVLEEAVPVFSKAFPCVVTDDIRAMKWLKLFVNANNCLPAVLGKSMQETFAGEAVCRISLQIWREGWELVVKAGLPVADLPGFPKERVTDLLALPPSQAAAVFSKVMTGLSKEPLYGSILQSIKRDRASEIDYINGEFAVLARELGVPAPLNTRMVELVHRVEENKAFLSEEELIRQTKEWVT